MKTLLMILALAISSGALSAKDDTRLASYYLATPEKFDGQTITLDCSRVNRINAEAKDGKVKFFIITSKGKGASPILATVPLEESDDLMKTYGTKTEYKSNGSVKTSPITGKFVNVGGSWMLEYQPSK